MAWHVVSVNSRTELEITKRISDAGFISHCPTWVRKCGHHIGGRHFFKTRIEVLFPTYLFVAEDIGFRKEEFESSKTRLTVFRKRLLTDEAMAMINSTANDLTAAQSKMTHSLTIKRGDVMQVLHGALQGEPVEVLQVRRDRILIRLKRVERFTQVEINASSLGKAI